MIFISIGLWVLFQWATEQKEKLKSIEPPWTIVDIWRVLKEPQEADLDRSGSIRGVEVFVVAIALSLDSLATGIGTTIYRVTHLCTWPYGWDFFKSIFTSRCMDG